MAFYRKNIGRPQQAARIALGLFVAAAAFAVLPGLWAWLATASGIGFALTGLIGWCPACAMAGIARGNRT